MADEREERSSRPDEAAREEEKKQRASGAPQEQRMSDPWPEMPIPVPAGPIL